MSAINEAIQLVRPHVKSNPLASRAATRFFLFWFPLVSVVLYGGGALLMNSFSTADFQYACYFGMGLCTITSVISFFITEWAIDMPTPVFLGIGFGSIFVRIFTLLFAFTIGQFFMKMNPMGMAFGMFATYFSYLVIEIAYIHKKALTRGM